jgi:hypothetical protein
MVYLQEETFSERRKNNRAFEIQERDDLISFPPSQKHLELQPP